MKSSNELNTDEISGEANFQTGSPQRSRGCLQRLAGPAILLALCTGFFWKLVLTNQYTWLDSPDLANMIVPWYQLEAQEWHQGRVPLWDPYLYGGQTLIGQAEPGVVYPLNWVLFWLPLRHGWIRQGYLHWYFVLIHFMAALFCYWLCRDLKRSQPASILAGAAFGLGGYLGTTDWPYMLNGAVWAPLVFLFLLRALRGERPAPSAAAAGAFLGMAWLSGHHQVPLFISLAVAAVWLYHILRRGRPDWRLVRLGVIFTAILVLVSGAQALPAYEYGKRALRWVNMENPVGWKDPVPYLVHDRYSLIPSSLLGIVIPGRERNADPFIGVVALTLALLAIALCWNRKPVRLFAAVAAGGLLFSLGRNDVFQGILYAVVPLVEKARNPSMAVSVFHFGIAVLAAYGVDSFLSHRDSVWQRRAAAALTIFGVLPFAALMVLALTGKAIGDDRPAVIALVALLLAALVYGWRRGNLSHVAAASLAVGLMLIEFGNVSGIFWRNRSDASRPSFLAALRENSDLAAFLRKQAWPFRLEVLSEDIPFNFGDWYGIDVFGGFQASLPVNLMRLDIGNDRVRNLFGVNYAIGKAPRRPTWKEVFQGASGLKVYWNSEAFPRVWSVHEAARIERESEIGDIIRDDSFDLRRKTFLFGSAPPLRSCEGSDNVKLLRRNPESLTIEADMQCEGLVVISDSYFPGWQATVDGKPAKIYEAYTAIRGVPAGPGKHTIEMKFRPLTVYLGGLMTLAGLLAAALLAVWPRLRGLRGCAA